MDETDLISDLPAPVSAALRFLDYCRFRTQPFDEWGERQRGDSLDLDEMRTRQAALESLRRYFDGFERDIASVFDSASAAIREADAARRNEQRDQA